MLLKKLTVENFGVFRGKHTFNLIPEVTLKEQKPIILFGGFNGTGKTTLFESVKVCLYGRFFRNFRTKSDYNKNIRNRIIPKKKKRRRTHHGAIEIEFNYSSFGKTQQYSIRRFWTIKSNKFTEDIRVLRDGKILGAIERDYSQAFLMNLIPRGLSNLFFFDGEKIQSLAEDTRDNIHFKEAFDSVIGLDIIHKLQNDLKIYQSRQFKKITDSSIEKQIQQLRKEKRDYETQHGNLSQKKAQKVSRIDHIKSQIESKEIELANQGGGYATKRNIIKNDIEETESHIFNLREEIRKLCGSLFPFSLIPNLCKNLRDNLITEQKYKNQLSARITIKDNLSEFEKKVDTLPIFNKLTISEQNKDELVTQLQTLFNDIFLQTKHPPKNFIHDFSDTELTKVLSWIDQSINWISYQMIKQTQELEKSTMKRRNLEGLFQKIPSDEILSPIVKDLNMLYSKNGEITSEIKKLEEDLHSINYRLEENERNYNKLIEQQYDERLHIKRLELVKKTQNALNEYIAVLRTQKLDTFSTLLTECMNLYLHKEELVSKVNINSEDYSINLHRIDGTTLDKNELSAGEKQIYAIAMLMALARSSGRPLPFMIDTPLARLDSLHRKKIVTQFFPYASHQVIIFSTDTEVDKKQFNELTPFISRVYHLTYNSNTSSTSAKEGYFWKKR